MATREMLSLAKGQLNLLLDCLREKPRGAIDLLDSLSDVSTSDRSLQGLQEGFTSLMRLAEMLPQSSAEQFRERLDQMIDGLEDELPWEQFSEIEVSRWRRHWGRLLDSGFKLQIPPVPELNLSQRRNFRQYNFRLIYLPELDLGHLCDESEGWRKESLKLHPSLPDRDFNIPELTKVPIQGGKWLAMLQCEGDMYTTLRAAIGCSFLATWEASKRIGARINELLGLRKGSVRAPTVEEFKAIVMAANAGATFKAFNLSASWCHNECSDPALRPMMEANLAQLDGFEITFASRESTGTWVHPIIDLDAI